MKPPPLIASFLLVLGTSFLVAAEEHPHMHDASTALRAAQTSAHPLDDLKEARQRLNAARENKGGYRAEAIRRIDTAIAALQEGKRIEANKEITQAITAIEKGVALHPRDNRKKR